MGVCRFAFLPVELCGAHYLSIEQLAALKYLPCLLYRVEVRPSLLLCLGLPHTRLFGDPVKWALDSVYRGFPAPRSMRQSSWDICTRTER